jgi:hypothetical protein
VCDTPATLNVGTHSGGVLLLLRRQGLFNPDAVARILAENDAGRAEHAYLIYALLTLEIGMQTFVDHRTKCLAT